MRDLVKQVTLVQLDDGSWIARLWGQRVGRVLPADENGDMYGRSVDRRTVGPRRTTNGVVSLLLERWLAKEDRDERSRR